MEDSLDRVLFAAELEFPKILVPRLPQHTSNVNNECPGKSEWSKQLYSLYVTSFLEHWYNLIYYSDINLFLIDDAWRKVCNIWLLLCEINSRLSLYQSLTLKENIVAVISQDRMIDDNLKKQIKNQTLCTCRLLLLT